MKKIDYKKELKYLYKPSAKNIEFVEVPKMNFLMINGKGNPNTSIEYQNAVETLYAVSYAVKFLIKKSELQTDYGVMPLEGLWWVDDMQEFDINNKDNWKWIAMIMQPEIVTKEHIETAFEQVKKKKILEALSEVEFAPFQEGKSAQTLYIGPFKDEGPTIEKIHTFITENKSSLSGKHHEIYLSDIRKAKPENWKTIIRQPVK
jgi:hypothetical protein